MALIRRSDLNRPLTYAEMDGNFDYLEALAQSGATSGTGSVVSTTPVDIVYNDLYTLAVNSSLEVGTWYRLTDYKSVNYLNGFNVAKDYYNSGLTANGGFDPIQTHVGQDEVVLLHATSDSEISPIGYSETYKGDIVEYNLFVNKLGYPVNVTNYNNIYGVTDSIVGFDLQWDGTNVYFTLPSTHPVSFGHYFYLYAEFYDTLNDIYYYQDAFEPIKPGVNICEYSYTSDDPDYNYIKSTSRIEVSADGLTVKLLDLTQDDVTNYYADSLEVEYIAGEIDAYGWINRRNCTTRNINVPFDFREHTYRRYEIDLSTMNPAFSSPGFYANTLNYGGYVADSNSYRDFKSLDIDGYECYDVYINGLGGPDDGRYYRGTCYNNVFTCYMNNLVINSPIFYDNTIGDPTSTAYFRNSRIEGGFDDNLIVNGFYDNIVNGRLSGNRIKSSFFSNNLVEFLQNQVVSGSFNSNTITERFNYNIVNGNLTGNVLVSVTSNTIGDGFYYNEIDTYFNSNTIGFNFSYNKIGYSFTGNTTADTFQSNFIGNGFSSITTLGSFTNNTIGNSFNGNGSIGSGFTYNNIGSNFASNLNIGSGFRNNNISPNVISINFATASHVYQQYDVNIFKSAANAYRLSYIDASNQLVIANANA